MNDIEKKYIGLSLHILEKWLPLNEKQMLQWYESHPDSYLVEDDVLTYCLFSYPCTFEKKDLPISLERNILLVYDKEQIIADMSGYSGRMDILCKDKETVSYLCEESGWIDLEQYILNGLYGEDPDLNSSLGFIMSNAYVTSTYRRRHIFSTMENMMHDYVLRNMEDHVIYYSIVSLDPDVACYGPDASDEPYVYSYDKDEPVRKNNRMIMQKLGYEPIQLEAEEVGDGTKIWFAVKKEADTVIDSSVSF